MSGMEKGDWRLRVESGPWVLASRANYNASQPLRRLKRSPPLRLKLPHVLHQPLHSLDRHGVVDRRAHAADGAVAFELHHAARFRTFQKLAVEFGVREGEGEVHARAV